MKSKHREPRTLVCKTKRVFVTVTEATAGGKIFLNTQSFEVPDTTRLVRAILRVIGEESPDYNL